MIKMEPRKLIVNQEQDLKKAALELIEFSGKDRILCFYGEMGAGKTTFIRYLCRELGVLENVSSPTFSIVNEYRTQSGERVYHCLLYTSDAADERSSVDLGGRRIINKKKKKQISSERTLKIKQNYMSDKKQ